MRCCKCHKKIKAKDIKLNKVKPKKEIDRLIEEIEELKKYQKNTMLYTMIK